MNNFFARRKGWLVGLAALLGVFLLGWALLSRQPEAQVQSRLIPMERTPPADTFTRAQGPRDLVFPRDHGPHPDFQTEWWYYTGNLEGQDGRRFGYQLTFFRRAVLPEADGTPRASDWAANQIYMAHFTLTDASSEQFHYFERFERGAAGLAGAQGEPAFQVWLRDWSVEQTGQDEYRLRAAEGPITLDLRLFDSKGIVLQGDRGYSRKGPQPGNASLYYSQTRLESQGTVSIDGSSYEVSGLSWLDREISTSALSKGQVGWDWFALQLDDGSEIMAYVLRREDGTIDAFSNGTFIFPDGSTLPLSRDDFQIMPEGEWRSPHSGGTYPARWQLNVPSLSLNLTVEPQVADQELNVSFIYWEGSVRITGAREGKPVQGFGYVELTGYAESLEGQL